MYIKQEILNTSSKGLTLSIDVSLLSYGRNQTHENE